MPSFHPFWNMYSLKKKIINFNSGCPTSQRDDQGPGSDRSFFPLGSFPLHHACSGGTCWFPFRLCNAPWDTSGCDLGPYKYKLFGRLNKCPPQVTWIPLHLPSDPLWSYNQLSKQCWNMVFGWLARRSFSLCGYYVLKIKLPPTTYYIITTITL